MKKIVALLALISVVRGLAQNQADTSSGKKHKILIGASFSPNYCYRTLINNGGGSITSSAISFRNSYEIPKYGYSTGINLFYELTSHIEFGAGFSYSNIGFQIDTKDLTWDNSFSNPAFVPPPNLFVTYNYIDIPLKVFFSYGNKRIRFISGIGINGNILVNNTSLSSSFIDEYNISPEISLGIECRLYSRMYLRAEPSFQYEILSTIRESDLVLEQHLWSAGVNVSLLYHF